MAATVFLASEAAIMDGRFTGDLLAATPVAGALDEIAGFTRSRIFETRERFQTEVMGGEVLTSLLDAFCDAHLALERRSEEHTSELQSLMRISYAVFCLKKKKQEYTIKDNSKDGIRYDDIR